jgi:hypothetical protein
MKSLSGAILIFSSVILYGLQNYLKVYDSTNYGGGIVVPYESFLYGSFILILFLFGLLLIIYDLKNSR